MLLQSQMNPLLQGVPRALRLDWKGSSPHSLWSLNLGPMVLLCGHS